MRRKERVISHYNQQFASLCWTIVLADCVGRKRRGDDPARGMTPSTCVLVAMSLLGNVTSDSIAHVAGKVDDHCQLATDAFLDMQAILTKLISRGESTATLPPLTPVSVWDASLKYDIENAEELKSQPVLRASA